MTSHLIDRPDVVKAQFRIAFRHNHAFNMFFGTLEQFLIGGTPEKTFFRLRAEE